VGNKLSHSARTKFEFCPTAYKHHYVNRYRPLEVSSSLPFGSAIDKAFEFMLDNTKLDPVFQNDPDSNKDPITAEQVFDYHWSFADINGTLTNLQNYQYLVYSKYDYDQDLLNHFEVENHTAWESLRIKGHLMIQTFREEFLPQVQKVYETQVKTVLSNDEGDEDVGYADAVLQLDGCFKPVITDFKTASRPYEQDSVKTSAQLARYLYDLSDKYDTRLAAFVVFNKNIQKNKVKICSVCGLDGSGSRAKTCDIVVEKKRCAGAWIETLKPKSTMQLIIDTIPRDYEEMVVENIAAINDTLKHGIFIRNLKGCNDNGFGRRCEFFNLCHNKSEEGLIKKD
jgi:hypothetical protein